MTPPVRGRALALRLGVVAVFLLALVWQVLGGVSDLLLWVSIAAVTRGQLSATAWTLLGGGLLIPVAAAVAGLLLARRRSTGTLALVLLAALCTSRALGVTQLALFLRTVGAL